MPETTLDVRTLNHAREATITTWGRKTGNKHEVVVWWATDSAETIYVMAGYGPSTHWALNALTSAGSVVRVARQRFAATARVVNDAAEHSRAARLLAEKYRPYPGAWDDGHILALELRHP